MEPWIPYGISLAVARYPDQPAEDVGRPSGQQEQRRKRKLIDDPEQLYTAEDLKSSPVYNEALVLWPR